MSNNLDAIASAHASARHHWQKYRYHEERADMMSGLRSTDAIETERLKAETHLALCTCYRSIVGMLRELRS